MRLDLHNYVTIGFQSYWLKLQKYNPEHLLENVVEECFFKDIDVCGITSKEFNIPKGSVHDRFGYLVNQAKDLPKEFRHDKIDNTALIVEKEDKKVVLLNVQGVITKNSYGGRTDYLAIGDNQIKNDLPLKDSLKEAKENGLITIVHYPFLTSESYCGMYEGDLNKTHNFFDAIAVHDAQIPFPLNLANIMKKRNIKKNHSKRYNLPMIAVSGAHMLENIGTAHISYDGILSLNNRARLLNSLKYAITKQTGMQERSISLFDFLDYASKFKEGLKNINQTKEEDKIAKSYVGEIFNNSSEFFFERDEGLSDRTKTKDRLKKLESSGLSQDILEEVYENSKKQG